MEPAGGAAPNRLREYRESLGQTQTWLAEKAGVHVRNIQAIEAGRRSPSIETAWKIANALQAKDVGLVFPGRRAAA